ncbi:MAG: helix-turn-helix transcriptional regulator [Candidatus Nanoarchaeia archaeon]|nr:helix-turn-helix transcriptional regulator [Candidatus Nanoarchaeia archaeon]
MNFKKLNAMITLFTQENKISREEFCKSVGITPQGFGRMLSRGTIKIDTLERISEKLNISPSAFFNEIGFHHDSDEKKNTDSVIYDVNLLYNQIEHLKNELKLKDELIETYHSLISNQKKK